MNTCDTCKHWAKDAGTPETDPKGGYCQLFGVMDGESFFFDASPDQGELYTGPKFGCVHWKPK